MAQKKKKRGFRGCTVNSSANTPKPSEVILNLLWSLKKDGMKDSTLEATGRRLWILQRNIGLVDPEKVKEYIAKLSRSDSYKRLLCISYDKYVKFMGLSWIKPRYRGKSRLPYVATEEIIDRIIGCASKRSVPLFVLLKETGIRPIELHELEERDYNKDIGTINIQETKYGNPRILKLKSKTVAMLNEYIARYGINFPDSKSMRRRWSHARNKAYEIYHDPVIRQVRLYDLRHFKATREYHRTKDILYVMKIMGHKNIRSTLIYTHLVEFRSEEYTCKVAKTLEEIRSLIEEGFEKVTEYNNLQIFRKRK